MLLLERPLDATDAWTAVRGVRWGQRGAFVAWGLPPQLRVGLDTKDFFTLWYVLGDVEPVVRSVYTILMSYPMLIQKVGSSALRRVLRCSALIS